MLPYLQVATITFAEKAIRKMTEAKQYFTKVF